MSNKLSYSVLLNSYNSNGGGINNLQYYVNWRVVIPEVYRTFRLTWAFKSDPTTTELTNSLIVSINLGSTTCYDSSCSNTNCKFVIVPKSYDTTTANAPNFYYESEHNDNSAIMAFYPTNSLITVNLSLLNGTLINNAVMPSYSLQLFFEVIDGPIPIIEKLENPNF